MKNMTLLVIFALLSTWGCLVNAKAKHEEKVELIAQEQNLGREFGRKFDSAFTRENIDFSKYTKIRIEPLNLSNVKILQQTGRRPSLHVKPWVLTKRDEAFYKKQYQKSATRYLIDKGHFSPANASTGKVLILRSEVTQIAPLGVKNEIQIGRIDSFSRGFGRMTISMKLYDAETNQLLAIVSDRRELGKLWEKNNRVRDYAHVRQGFNVWLKRLGVAIKNA